MFNKKIRRKTKRVRKEKIILRGENEKEQQQTKVIYICQTKGKVILYHETKSSKVRVTYLASGLEWVWDLEWRPWVLLDSKGGARSWALDAKFEGGKKQV